jgi:hypothetical protein
MSVCLLSEDILDEFNSGNWLLLNKVAVKSGAIRRGNKIQVRERKALVNEMIFGEKDRLALQVTYLGDEDGG